ncbi:hypothetical protein PMZ80_010118 [Knufia obscura]|uniref:UDENN FLCN/SMCR8-type domain-containing protein n=2 Tax=Knufia TaxID=430999 RepID=A0AAN8EKG9_9EURO|nr:hypothetical protein PMZ80_010118 [Knufia obscura]KAK5952857.1 hypothetical protein OHC33_005978 [Knufia fluminis]
MDFTLALTHFCEVHGPKSVLCTQVLPLECTICIPPPTSRERRTSAESYTTQIGREDERDHSAAAPRLRRTDTDFSLPPALSKASTAIEGQPLTPGTERVPAFRRSDTSKETSKFPYGRSHGDTCASCSFTIPQKTAAQLPEGAPGSLSKDGGKPKNGAPVLRSREFVCLGKGRKRQNREEPSSSQESQGASADSFGSTISHSDCHDHTLTYLTSKSPDDAENYAQLRASVIRALSFEVLPRGMSEGPFCFGDSTSGYTIAYTFRLTDPKARGKRRAYAFVALAGKDADRAFKACPMIWEAFTMMSKTIEQAATKYQEEEELKQQKEHDEMLAKEAKAGYTNVSSFLTQRPRDPDGQPRRAGQTQPRSLAEIIGDENIFAILHQYFVHVLRCLGDKFGGLPLADSTKMVIRTTANESEGLSEGKVPARVSAEVLANLSIDDDHPLKKAQNSSHQNDGAAPKEGANVASNSKTAKDTNSTSSSGTAVKRNSQCAPLPGETTRQRQVAV